MPSNKDTYIKAVTESLQGGALAALDIQGADLREELPTELPAGMEQVDRVWRMGDGRIFHLEAQSSRESALHRFHEYDARLARHYLTKIRTVVLYHDPDVRSAPEELDIGTAQYRVENVFIAHFDGDAALDAVSRHIRDGCWTSQDRLRLALALNMMAGRAGVSDRLKRVLGLLPLVPRGDERELVAAALIQFSDKAHLTGLERNRLEEELRNVSKIAEELYEQGMEKGMEKGMAEGEEKARWQVAARLLREGMAVEKVAELTDLPIEDVRRAKMERQ